MYYWTLLNKSENELVKKVFDIQKEHSVKEDWIEQIKDDLNSLDIEMKEEEIKVMKKETFKNIVKKKLKEKALDFLLTKKAKHSKTENLNSYKFQQYLSSGQLTTNEKKLLFSLRTRSVDVKRNYRGKYRFNMHCSLCRDESEEETELHLLKCSKIIDEVKEDIDLTKAKYEDIFSNKIEDQVVITKIFCEVFKAKKLLKN